MRYIIIFLTSTFLFSCIPSKDYTGTKDASHLTNQCYRLKEPAFLFEGRCADLTGVNDNSELCNSIQIAGKGGFPADWDAYLKIRKVFDKEKFKRLAFEKQRTMLAFVHAGTEIKITRIVHHGWGTNGRYWAIRGNIFLNKEIIEVELPSFRPVHHKPFWLNGRVQTTPELNNEFMESCT